jgi:anti-sigma B factor antagonist
MSARAISLVRQDGDACVVELTGEYDLSSIDELTDALGQAASSRGMIVDLSSASFIDSAVLGALITSHREAAANGRRWALVIGNGSGAAVRRILELTGLDGVLPVYSDVGDALAAGSSRESGLPE